MSTADFLTDELISSTAFIEETATRLKALTQSSQQVKWHVSLEVGLVAVLHDQNWPQWPIAPLNERGHIAWPKGKQSLWLCQHIVVPEALAEFHLTGLSLRLGLTWWADAVKIYVNGVCVQEGDLFDYFARIPLSDRVTPGDTFSVAIHLISPGHDDGALVRSDVIYETANTAELPEPGFIADELTVLKTYAAKLAPEKLPDLAAAIAPLDWSTVSQRAQFQAELAALRQRLRPFSHWIKQRRIACVGHAHLDLAWLWPVEDTWRAAERTFRSVLSLQKSFPEMTYTHSSPALFAWLEDHLPELFHEVQQAVEAGTWAIDAGLWVEPELNTIGGESLARQILYGQRYVRSRFAAVSAIAWLPDSFGFSWQLPQLLAQGGVQYFATQKLRWNDTTTFPHSLFWWEGLDGTRILSLTLPPIGSDIAPEQIATHSAEWEAKTGLPERLWLPGMGDHGGGPTRDMLEKARRWADSPFFPELRFTSVVDHIQVLCERTLPENHTSALQDSAGSPPVSPAQATHLENTLKHDHENPNPNASPPPIHPSTYPIWRDELYLELHRGCYTTHAEQKWFNRRCEQTLVEAELFATLGQIQRVFDYPKETLETAWKQVLFNQFHDILPGTAIPEVFATVNPNWQAAYDTADAVRTEALTAIAHHIPLPPSPHEAAIPIVVFNPLNWERTDLVTVSLASVPAEVPAWKVFDPATQGWLLSQPSHYLDHSIYPPGLAPQKADDAVHLLFLATVPSIGYRLFWLVPDLERTQSATASASKDEWELENDFLRAVVDPASGDLSELWEKTTQINVVRSPANQLQAFQDSGRYWDAWDIAPDYADHPLPPTQLKSIEWLEYGPLRQRLRVMRELGSSTFQQDYVLDQHLPYLKVATVADWQASQVVLKVAFPLSIQSDHATFEIPCGAIDRPTQATDPHEQAKWEVPALRWADLSDEQVGLSILTDYKHGFDTQPQQLRLTLLKAPIWPDPTADRGFHAFTYALYPHAGNWQQGKTPNHTIAFNTPLRSVFVPGLEPQNSVETQNLAPLTDISCAQEFLSLGTDAVHLSAFTPSEDDADAYVLRCWDLYGEGVTLDITTLWGTPTYQRVDLLETAIALDTPEKLAPWQVATLKFSA